MENIGVDVHKVQSQACIISEAGERLERRIRTERGRFAAVFGRRPQARILIEASTVSEWVARCLDELGHEVVVADPNFAPMCATRSKRVKTDRRDARALAEACSSSETPDRRRCSPASDFSSCRRREPLVQFRPPWGSRGDRIGSRIVGCAGPSKVWAVFLVTLDDRNQSFDH